MTPSEIITADAQQHGVDPQKVLNFVAAAVHSNKGTLMSAGNSILLLVNFGADVAECHLYTQDAPLSLHKALVHFLSVVRKSPIKRLYGQADNEGIIKMLQSIGLQVQKSDLPRYNWMANL
jgi:hypothetical protein